MQLASHMPTSVQKSDFPGFRSLFRSGGFVAGLNDHITPAEKVVKGFLANGKDKIQAGQRRTVRSEKRWNETAIATATSVRRTHRLSMKKYSVTPMPSQSEPIE